MCLTGVLSYSLGIDRNSPQLISALRSLNVTSIGTGGYHCLARTEEGELYTWGNYNYGQLGLGHRDLVHFPQKVDILTLAKPKK